MNPVASLADRAHALLAEGRAQVAVDLVASAARKGDADAMHLLALWHVYGDPVPRSFAVARALFQRAGEAGHAESARVFAVFVALGAAAPKDWSQARKLLERAAKTDPLAAAQCDLIASMQLTAEGAPSDMPRLEPLTQSPLIGLAKRLFSRAECAHVIALSTPRMTPSVVVDPSTGAQSPHPIRTSDGTVLGPIQQDLVVHALNLRIAALTGTREEQGEPLGVLRYAPGQQYRLHHDCLPGEENQRVLTAITYLNDDFGAGGTYFAEHDLTVRPEVGDCLAFRNVLADGSVDERSRHAGLPVTRGEKWICTRWIRRADFDPWGMRCAGAT